MLRKKLYMLDHPNPAEFNVNDETEFRSAIIWLEDQKIRHYKIEDRDHLRNLSDPQWNNSFKTYLTEVGCSFVDGTPIEQLLWLLSLAHRLEFSDQPQEYNSAIKEIKAKRSSAPNIISKNPIDNLDFSSNTFKSAVSKLATMGCVGPTSDSKMRLSALSNVLTSGPHPLPSGYSTETIKSKEDVINLLFIADLRSLQTGINETLVSVQKVTANPKTDSTLGHVGS